MLIFGCALNWRAYGTCFESSVQYLGTSFTFIFKDHFPIIICKILLNSVPNVMRFNLARGNQKTAAFLIGILKSKIKNKNEKKKVGFTRWP